MKLLGRLVSSVRTPYRRSSIIMAALLVSAGLFVPLHGTEADGLLSGLTSFGTASLFVILASILWLPIWFFGVLIGRLIWLLVLLATYNNFGGEKGVELGWTIVRDISNMFFIVVLLVIAIATIFKVESYSYRQLLPKLVIMAVLINFSRTIALFFIDISQIIMLTFVNAFKDIAAGNIINGTGVADILGLVDSISLLTGDAAAYQLLGTLLLGVGMLVVTAGVLLVFIAVFTFRIVMLWILIILSPLAYILAVLPGGQRYASQWWEKFIPNLITGPVLAFFLWLSLTILNQNLYLEGFKDQLAAGRVMIDANPFMSTAGTGASAFNFIITIALLMGSLAMVQQIGGAAASFAGTVSGKLEGLGRAAIAGPGKGVKELANFGIDKLQESGRIDLNLPRVWKKFKETKEHKRHDRYLQGTLNAASKIQKLKKGPLSLRRIRALAYATAMPGYMADEMVTVEGLARLGAGNFGVQADEKVKKGVEDYEKIQRKQTSKRMLLKGMGAEQKEERESVEAKAKGEYEGAKLQQNELDNSGSKLKKLAGNQDELKQEEAREIIRKLASDNKIDEGKFLVGNEIKVDEFIEELKKKAGATSVDVQNKKEQWEKLKKANAITEKTATSGAKTPQEAEAARNAELDFINTRHERETAGKQWEFERLAEYEKQVINAGSDQEKIDEIIESARGEGFEIRTKEDLIKGREAVQNELAGKYKRKEEEAASVKKLTDDEVGRELTWEGIGKRALAKKQKEIKEELEQMGIDKDGKFTGLGLKNEQVMERSDRLWEIAKTLKQIDKDIRDADGVLNSATASTTDKTNANNAIKIGKEFRERLVKEAEDKGGVFTGPDKNFLKTETVDGEERVERGTKFFTATQDEVKNNKRREEMEEYFKQLTDKQEELKVRLETPPLSTAQKERIREEIIALDKDGKHLKEEIAHMRMPTNFDEAAARRQLESEELKNIGNAQNASELTDYLRDAIHDKRWGRIGAIMRSLAQDYNDNEFTNRLGYTSDSAGMRQFAEEELIKKAGMTEQAALALINDISYINEKTNHWESARLINMENGKFKWNTEAGHAMEAMAEIRKGDLRTIARNFNRLAYGGEKEYLNGDREFFIKPLGLSVMQTFAPEIINQMTFRGGELNKNALHNIYANPEVLKILKQIPQIWNSKFTDQNGRTYEWEKTIKRYVGSPEAFKEQAGDLGSTIQGAMGKFVQQDAWRRAMQAAFSDNYSMHRHHAA